MRRALLRCALALASLPAARSEGGGVDGLISNVIDTATPGLQKAVDLAPGININQADMDRFKAEKGKVDAVTTRVERFSQSRPLGKPGEGLDCVYRMRGAGLKAINHGGDGGGEGGGGEGGGTQLPDTAAAIRRRRRARRRRRRRHRWQGPAAASRRGMGGGGAGESSWLCGPGTCVAAAHSWARVRRGRRAGTPAMSVDRDWPRGDRGVVRERREERQVVVGQVAEARRDLPLRAVADRDARRRVEPAVGGDHETVRRERRGRGGGEEEREEEREAEHQNFSAAPAGRTDLRRAARRRRSRSQHGFAEPVCRHVLVHRTSPDAMRRAPVLLLAALSPTSAAIVADVSGCAAVDQYKAPPGRRTGSTSSRSPSR